MARESCQDEPKGREGVGVPPPLESPATAIVRSVQPYLMGVHAAASMVAAIYAAITTEGLAPDVPGHRLEELGRRVAREGMRASRLLKRAAKEVR